MAIIGDSAVPDAARGNWVDHYAPPGMRPFLRLARIDRPIGWWLLLLPCWWSVALAAGGTGQRLPDPVLLVLFLIGAVAMRAAGSTYNDIVDRDLDRKVERTRNRPLASGAVSVRAAVVFCCVLVMVGALVLLSLNRFSVVLGLCSLVPVALYPFMKRITSWPQVMLGLAFSWGALIGWSSVTASLSAAPVCLYIAAIAWTMGYDTIYAVQDIEDDAIAGIRSTALLFGDRTRLAVSIMYAVAVLFAGLSFDLAQSGIFAWAGLVAFAVHLGFQSTRISMDNRDRALRLFQSNRDAGLILFAGLAADAFMR